MDPHNKTNPKQLENNFFMAAVFMLLFNSAPTQCFV